MKQYVIDDLRPDDVEILRDYLAAEFGAPALESIFWMPIDDDLLGPEQSNHTDCRPFFFAVELTPEKIACELLVRTKHRVRCDCTGYADEAQREWLIRKIDAIFNHLNIPA